MRIDSFEKRSFFENQKRISKNQGVPQPRTNIEQNPNKTLAKSEMVS